MSRSLVCGSLALGLTLGCRTVLPSSDRSSFYVLTALAPPAPPAPASPPSILLGPVVLPTYLDRRELVTRLGTNQLRAEDLELWAEPLRDSLARILEQDLEALLGGGQVQRLPWTAAAPPALVVAVDLTRFERTDRGRVELEAYWTVSRGRGASDRLGSQTRLSLPAGPSTATAVASLSQTLATLGEEIAKTVQLLAPANASR